MSSAQAMRGVQVQARAQLLLAAILAGCTGVISADADAGPLGSGKRPGRAGPAADQGGGDPGSSASGSDDDPIRSQSSDPAPLPDVPADLLCQDRDVLGMREPGVRRLTSVELKSSLRALLGDDVWQRVRSLADVIPEDGNADTVSPTHTATQVNAFVELANEAANTIVDDDARRTGIVGACADSATPDEACVRQFVTRFGRSAFRRPLAAGEVDSLVQGYLDSDPAFALKVTIGRILSSPDVQFVIETGTGVDAERVRLTPYEVASRIAFGVTRQAPDGALLDAAAAGELDAIDGVRAQVARLLQTEAGRASVLELYDYWLGLSAKGPSNRTAAREGLDAAGLKQELSDEARRFIEYVVFEREGAADALLSDNRVFPATERVAAIYGTAVSTDPGGVVPDGARPGILTHASLLLNETDVTSPIHRAANILKHVLCENIPLPDPELVAARQEEVESFTRAEHSTRERTDNLTSPPTCTACHSRINPVGYLFEGFDELGRQRDEEVVYDDAGNEIARHTIDTRVDNVPFNGVDSGPLASPAELADFLIEQREALHLCYARQILRFTRLRLEDATDACAIADAAKVLDGGGSLLDGYVAMLGGEQIFWRGAGQ